ncbi:MAG: 4-alpha-glucanotransferase [Candidatus Celerinatantimonas neptuna]|nr:MAG: 4-alpha-glucanotransferase [Candidatus Celerinatantimonas neptuna]
MNERVSINDSDVEKLLNLHGITRHFIDAWGNETDVDSENLCALLKAMGYDIDDDNVLHQQLNRDLENYWQLGLEPVTTSRIGEPVRFLLRYRQGDIHTTFEWKVKTEQGQLFSGTICPDQCPLEQHEILRHDEIMACWIDTEIELECGYHQLLLQYSDQDEPFSESCYIVAPTSAYKPFQIYDGAKVWGVTVQLYALRSQRNWGIGDFSDLMTLVQHIAKGGGNFIGLNPLHALYPGWPEHASPYSPSSRQWLNTIYIDVEAIDEFSQSEAISHVYSYDFQQRLDELRALDWIDYSAVMELKLSMLHLVFKQFQQLSPNHERRLTFKSFYQKEGDELNAQATFDALQVYFREQDDQLSHWCDWPVEFQDYSSNAVRQWSEEHSDDVCFYTWLQWIADEQLEQVARQTKKENMIIGLLLDVAVGVSSGSQEAWRDHQIYNLNVHVGAPPDVLGPLGQNWGLPPMDPIELKKRHYQPLIDLFRHSMHAGGALRIDHVMGLLRLWWVPAGKEAKDGAYVQYPLNDLLAILVLESHRNQCLVVGEDLGTVPKGISHILQDNGIHSYRIFFFSQAPDGGYISPQYYPEQALAALTTHDMATLKGFWHCEDLKLGQQLGLYPDPIHLKKLFDGRLYCKQRILDSLHGHHSIPQWIGHDAAWVPMDQTLSYGMQTHMARGNSALLSLQLEDWLDMEQPVNIPGTSQEYPNWRRKLNQTLEQMFSDPQIILLMQQLSSARHLSSKHLFHQ